MPTYIAADGAPLFYDPIGIGPRRSRAIVVIAGGAARHPSYLGDLAGLADEHELVVPHLRGVGRTPAPTLVESGGYWQQAADIESLREHLGVEQLIVVAHSAGTRVAISYAAQHPDRVAGLLLITPPTGYLVDEPSDIDALVDDRRGEPAFDAAIVALLAGPQGSTDDSFNGWQRLTAPASYARWDGVSQAHARAGRWSLAAAQAFFSTDPPPDLTARIRHVHAPVLVMAGAQDCFTGVAPQVALAALFPNGRCVVIDHCGHYPWVEQPRAFRTDADQFLDPLT
ncbi:alpha/beta fold hydrolase [Pengzhenrongella phosphoraccumulans]|uniref:alpha/beta fold hydrolase n=1 Tax=Pengzhenrongella phosphoraccumulans TaxID=3114394 RepID=UPI00388DE9E0